MASTIYAAAFDAQAVTTATDLFEITTVAADRPMTLYGMTLGQTTDLGDAQEEVLRIGFYRTPTAGSGGTAATNRPYVHTAGPSSTASISTVRGTASTGGTLLEVIMWNIRVPLMWIPIPELRPVLTAGEDPYTFRLLAAPTDSITVSGTLWWGEM